MAVKNRSVIHDTEAKEWKILERDSKGDEKVRDSVPDVEPMGEVEALQVFQGLVKEETNARRAALSMLCHIYMHAGGLIRPNILTQHLGKGDLKSGQLGTGIKEDFRKAEDAYFDQWGNPDHPQHKSYRAKLPKLNERSEPLSEEDRHAYFVTRTRATGSYANAKNLFLNYLAFVGSAPFESDEKGIIGILPPEVMREHVRVAKAGVQGPDNSWAAKMQDLLRELITPTNPAAPVKVDAARIPALIQDLKMGIGELERRLKLAEAAEKAITKVGDKVDIPAVASTMLERAQLDLKAGKPEQEEKATPSTAA